jgi:sigma-E factor negative regulatory protein RseC
MQEMLQGTVTEVDGDYAKVRPQRHTECDDCQACLAPEMVVLAYNPHQAVVGQKVEYHQAHQGILLIAWVLFLQPLLSVFLGLWLGNLAAPVVGWPAPAAMVVGAALLFSVAVTVVVRFDRRYKRNQQNFAKITAIVR